MTTVAEFTDDRAALLDRLAGQVVARGLSVPASLFLEMHRPFALLSSQAPRRRTDSQRPVRR
jgi:hypothetical protein